MRAAGHSLQRRQGRRDLRSEAPHQDDVRKIIRRYVANWATASAPTRHSRPGVGTNAESMAWIYDTTR